MKKILFLIVTILIGIAIYTSLPTTKQSHTHTHNTTYSKSIKQAFRYPVNQNYVYDFNTTNATIHDNLYLTSQKIPIQNIDLETNATTLLKLKLTPTKKNNHLPSTLHINYLNHLSTHTFEPNATGVRYINLSHLPLQNNTTLSLRAENTHTENQQVTLIRLKNPQLQNKTILIIAPHPDDAEIAAFGLYKRYHKNCYIVTITAGEAGHLSKYKKVYKTPKEQSLHKGKTRAWESIHVPHLGGIPPERTLNLGYFDATLKKMYTYPEQNVTSLYSGLSDVTYFRKYNLSTLSNQLKQGSNWHSLVNNLSYILHEIKPNIIITPYPALDTHPDHKLSTIAVLHALQKSPQKSLEKFFLYTNHCTHSEYYPYGQSLNPIDLPPNLDNTIYFDAIYTHHLSPHTRQAKIYALDAMSDLRPIGGDTYFNTHKNRYFYLDYNYFRRAARMQELFFIIENSHILKPHIYNAISHTPIHTITVPTRHTIYPKTMQKSIFDLKTKKVAFSKKEQGTITTIGEKTTVTILKEDPKIFLNMPHATSQHVLLSVCMTAPENDVFQIFYKHNSNENYTEENSHAVKLQKGKNCFKRFIPSKFMHHALRIDIANKKGIYTIDHFAVYEMSHL
jgi:LmbE family N-acetylglucosaminyl deacetylase